jgi:shikimate dehydrogenase
MNTFGLLGEHLSHSFSPLIHSYLGDYEYRLFEKTATEVPDFLQNGDFNGINVTIPYKKTVIPYCDELSDSVKKIGSVNTVIRRSDGSLYGDNTDYFGFEYLLDQLGIGIAGKKAVVLGSGGASLTVRAVLSGRGARSVVVVSRTGEDNYGNLNRHDDTDIIVNTTPVGMYPDNGGSPVDLTLFKSCQAVADIIYNPQRTALLLDAEDLGIPCINGLPMLVAQAKRAAELFTGRYIDDSVISDITDSLQRRTKNVMLIGMPGSGKSTTGAALAAQLGRDFIDTDALIVQRAGKSIPELFAQDGEAAFRRIETEVLCEVSKKNGAVIATGGGVVKTPENRHLIRQNSFSVFLDRDPASLPTDGRPLSQRVGVDTLYRERLPLYNSWSDIKVTAHGVQETAEEIKERLKL